MNAASDKRRSRASRGRRVLILLCAGLLAAGCAGTQSRDTDPVNDPWEGFNRKVHAFNMGLDKVARPVAVGYDRVMPDPLQRGIGNFFRNLAYPVHLVNNLLQGKGEEAGIATERFLLNTVFGLFGFFDIATKAGIPEAEEDFGQTMAQWGWEDSRYLVLPLLGPNTVRDALGRIPHSYIHPLNHYTREEHNYGPWALDQLQSRAALLPRDEEVLEAYDPYVLIRDAWLQNRLYNIHDGDPPMPDYESYLEEAEPASD